MSAGLRPYPGYKASGVSWLGDVPTAWEVPRLKQVCSRSALYGANVESDRYTATGIRFLRTTDIAQDGSLLEGGVFIDREDASGYVLSDGDLLVSRSGTIGRAFLYASRKHGVCAYAGYLVRFMPGPRVLPQYLFAFTRTQAFSAFLAASAIRSTIANVNGDKYARLPLTLPPLAEQVAIVRYLDHVDPQIERFIAAKERLIELLEEEKQAIIHRAVTRGVDPDVPLKPSGVDWLGRVPEHWQVVALGRITDVLAGFAFPSSGFSSHPNDIRLLRGVNISPGSVRWDEAVRWPATNVDGLARYELEAGDLVLGLDRPVIASGIRVALVSDVDLPALLLQRVARIRTRRGLEADFALLLLGGQGFRAYVDPIFTGISVPHLSPEQVRGFRIGLPPRHEQQRITAAVDAEARRATAAASAARRHITLLREYRTRLISDVVTGKLDVREAAAKLPDDPDADDSALDEALEETVAA